MRMATLILCCAADSCDSSSLLAAAEQCCAAFQDGSHMWPAPQKDGCLQVKALPLPCYVALLAILICKTLFNQVTFMSGGPVPRKGPVEGSVHCAAAPAGGIGGKKSLSQEEQPHTVDMGARAWIQAPLTPGQRKAWRDRIGGCWKWSEALPGKSSVLCERAKRHVYILQDR